MPVVQNNDLSHIGSQLQAAGLALPKSPDDVVSKQTGFSRQPTYPHSFNNRKQNSNSFEFTPAAAFIGKQN